MIKKNLHITPEVKVNVILPDEITEAEIYKMKKWNGLSIHTPAPHRAQKRKGRTGGPGPVSVQRGSGLTISQKEELWPEGEA